MSVHLVPYTTAMKLSSKYVEIRLDHLNASVNQAFSTLKKECVQV